MVCSLGLTKMSLPNQTVINETTWAHGSFGKMAKTRRPISNGKTWLLGFGTAKQLVE